MIFDDATDFAPRALALVCAFNARRFRLVSLGEFTAQVVGDDPRHLVIDAAGSAIDCAEAFEQLATGVDWGSSAKLALPVPGHPVGLAGPVPFNSLAIDAGGAVIIGSRGYVPHLDARTVIWESYQAHPSPHLDARETARDLKQTLLDALAELAELDVATWQPEIPDLLLNAEAEPPPNLPACYPAQRQEDLARAWLCLEVASLGRQVPHSAFNAASAQRRDRVLDSLAIRARRAICGLVNDLPDTAADHATP